MIVKEALRSIRNDLSRAFFFWLTFLLTTIFIFLFFNLSYEVGEEGVMTLVTVFMVIICTVDIFFVNHFYMTAHAKDLAVRLICGATYTYLSFYLLIQVVFLLLLAMPAGIVIGYALMPVINQLLGTSIVITGDAMIRIAVVIGMIIFWILLFNLSFTYKSAASMMFNMQSEIVSGKSNVLMLRSKKKVADIRKYILFPLFLCPLVLLVDPLKPSVICTCFCIVIFSSFITGSWVPYLNDQMDKHINDPSTNILIGFHRMNVRYMKKNILLVNGSVLFVYSLLDQAADSNVFTVTIILSCCMVSFLMWFAYLFQYATEQNRKSRKLSTLLHLGYTKEQLKRILVREVIRMYSSTMLFFALVFIPVTISHFFRGVITYMHLGLVSACYLIPLIFCMIISLHNYVRAVADIKTAR